MGDVFSLFPFVLLFMFGIVGIAFWAALGERRRERARVANYQAVAAQRGWEYSERNDAYTSYMQSQPFGVGHGRTARHVFRGESDGREFVAFEYIYRTTTTDAQGHPHEETHYVAFAAVGLSGALPIIRVTPEGFGSKLAKAFGGVDVQVESAEFNREWRVWSHDERAAHGLLTPRMIERMLKSDTRGHPWVLEPGKLITTHNKKLDLEWLDARLATLGAIADLVPGFLAEDYPAGGGKS